MRFARGWDGMEVLGSSGFVWAAAMAGFAGTVILHVEPVRRRRKRGAELVGVAVAGVRMATGVWRRGLLQLGTEVLGKASMGEFVGTEVSWEGMSAEFTGTMADFASPAVV